MFGFAGPVSQTSCNRRAELNSGIKSNCTTEVVRCLSQPLELRSAGQGNWVLIDLDSVLLMHYCRAERKA